MENEPKMDSESMMSASMLHRSMMNRERKIELDDEELEELEDIYNLPSPEPVVSYKPIHCPMWDCQRIITTNALGTHLKKEHHRIPKHFVTYDRTKTLQLNLGKLIPGKTYCSAVLLLFERGEDPQSMQIDDFAVIPVLATRLKCTDTTTEASNVPKSMFNYDLPSTSRADMGDTQDAKEPYSNDSIVIWLSTLSPEDKECCITCLNEAKTAKYHYCGAVHSIRDSNNIEDILPKGNHLMVMDSNLRKHPQKGLYLFRVAVMQNLVAESVS